MLIQRRRKEEAEVIRSTVSFQNWLDSGETIATIVDSTVTLGPPGAWSLSPFPVTPPYDPTPLQIQSAALIASATEVQLFLNSGTPGNTYTVAVRLQGTSGRVIVVEIVVEIAGIPPTPPPTVQPPFDPQALLLSGGVMTGPLVLSEDPQAAFEASTKRYVDNLFLTTVNDITNEGTARIAADAVLSAAISAETSRAETVETNILLAKDLVTGAGLNGGTINFAGTTTLSGTISANWQLGTVTAIGTGLTLSAGTLAPNWRLGTITALGTGLTLGSATLTPNWQLGTVAALGAGISLSGGTLAAAGTGVTKVSTTGAGITGGDITTSGTLAVEWNAGTVTAIGSGITLSGGTISSPAEAQEWTAGTVTAIGAGLTNSGGTIAASVGVTETLVRSGTVTTNGGGAFIVTYGSAFPSATVDFKLTDPSGTEPTIFVITPTKNASGFSGTASSDGTPGGDLATYTLDWYAIGR